MLIRLPIIIFIINIVVYIIITIIIITQFPHFTAFYLILKPELVLLTKQLLFTLMPQSS
jgi:hypothetical protein